MATRPRKQMGQEKSIKLVRGNCPFHGDIVGRPLGNGRMECPKCAANQAHLDANKTGIPLRFISKGLENYVVECEEQARTFQTASGYAGKFDEALRTGAGLVLIGNVGTGKTHLACAIGNCVRSKGLCVRYSTARNAFETLKDTWRRDSKVTKARALMQYTSPDLLILDEVGVQFGSEAERGLLYDIIDSRYGQLRPSILISNLSWEELVRLLGLRVADRMREGGELLEFSWESYRK